MIRNNLLNTTRCGKLLNSEMNTYSSILNTNLDSVIMSLTRGQSAWVNYPSETQRSAFSSGSVASNKKSFNSWLVGVTDGDGTFYFANPKSDIWVFSFQISQSTYNLRLLYHIKSVLGIGTITIDEKRGNAVYRVRNKKNILNSILPIFEAHPLLTSKYFKYNCFKQALKVIEDIRLSKEEKHVIISKLLLKSKKLPKGFVSPAWNKVLQLKIQKKTAEKVVSKPWLVGFTEAEGSFYLVKKSPERLVHCFEITQKLDRIVLENIGAIFGKEPTDKKTYSCLVISKQEQIKDIINYFFKSMKGMKSLEYRIWARSFNKRKRGFVYLYSIREKMRKIRSIRFSKSNIKLL